MTHDVAVLGAGPSGAATAIYLARRGLEVLLAQRERSPPPRSCESLTPTARPLLQELGLWSAIAAGPHLTCHAQSSAWGEPTVATHSHLAAPHGPALLLDRCAFDRAFVHHAAACGAEVLRHQSNPVVEPVPSGWRLEFGKRVVHARWVVDATGRAAWFATRQGARRSHELAQVAVICSLQTSRTGPLPALPILVESTANGWWYSAPQPRGGLSLVWFTDADLVGRAPRLRHDAAEALAAAPHTSQRVCELSSDARFDAGCGTRAVPATSSRNHPVAGANWLAVGDAAMTYDPLSGHGITAALAGARDAASAIVAGDHDAYSARLALVYGLVRRSQYALYHSERRWMEAPFWSRRHTLES